MDCIYAYYDSKFIGVVCKPAKPKLAKDMLINNNLKEIDNIVKIVLNEHSVYFNSDFKINNFNTAN